jgi:hypothetical protein
MPKSVTFLADALDGRVANTLAFVDLVEQNKINAAGEAWSIDVSQIELIYELAFLRMFGFWESFLEQLFLRLLCGYERSVGNEPLLAGQSYSKKIEDAQARILSGKNFVSWYVPSDMVGRSRKFFDGSNFEMVIASAKVILEDQSTFRHQIAHVQEHASAKFDAMTMRLINKRVRGSRPGRLLRSPRGAAGQNWLRHLSGQLIGLANQLAR